MNVRPRDRVALVVMGVLALLAAFYLLALKPERQKVSSLDSQIASERATLTQAEQSYATGRQAQAALKANTAEWDSLRLAVPAESDIPALLRTLQKTAAQVHVHMQAISLGGASGSTSSGASAASVTPASASSSSTASSSPSAAPGAAGTTTSTASAPQATAVPVQLSFEGGYTALTALVRRLEALVVVSGGKVYAIGPLLNINTISLSESQKLTVQLNASLYQLSAPTSATSTTGGQG